MHCGVMVTGYNQGDWERLLAGDYSRPPAMSDAANMDETLSLGEPVEPLGFDFDLGHRASLARSTSGPQPVRGGACRWRRRMR